MNRDKREQPGREGGPEHLALMRLYHGIPAADDPYDVLIGRALAEREAFNPTLQ